MTMRFEPTTAIVTANNCIRYLFAWLDFMRTASPGGPGWTIPLSSDGVNAGASDYIVDFLDLDQWQAGAPYADFSWFVLRAPDGSVDYLFYRFTANNDEWAIHTSPTGNFIGGDKDNLPTAGDDVQHAVITPTSAAENTLHMGADDATPYGFWTYMHKNGNFADIRAGMAHIPITDVEQPGEIAPYIVAFGDSTSPMWTKAGMTVQTVSTAISRCSGIPPGQALINTTPAWYMRDATDDIVPNGVPTDDNGEDLSFPIAFGSTSGMAAPAGFKGFSVFCQWNGQLRAAGETFSNKTRVSWGDVNFPWDGSTPKITP